MGHEADGGQAFPKQDSYCGHDAPCMVSAGCDGMTLRDYFAGQAIVGLLFAGPPTGKVEKAFEIADEMIAYRLVE